MDTIYQFTNIDAIIFIIGLSIMTYLLRNEYGKSKDDLNGIVHIFILLMISLVISVTEVITVNYLIENLF